MSKVVRTLQSILNHKDLLTPDELEFIQEVHSKDRNRIKIEHYETVMIFKLQKILIKKYLYNQALKDRIRRETCDSKRL